MMTFDVEVLLKGTNEVVAETVTYDGPEPAVAFGLSLEVLSGFWVDGQMTGGGDEGDRGWGVSTRVGL